MPPHSCLGIAASGGCESHVCLWWISTLQPVVMHWAEDFHGSQIGSFASDFLLSDPPLWCIAGCMLVYTFWQVQPILARREWTRESTSEEMERQSFRCVITWRLNVYLSKLSVATWKSIRLRPQITNCHWNAMKYMKASSSEVSCKIHQLLHMEGV